MRTFFNLVIDRRITILLYPCKSSLIIVIDHTIILFLGLEVVIEIVLASEEIIVVSKAKSHVAIALIFLHFTLTGETIGRGT
jgi:hypothetical protein